MKPRIGMVWQANKGEVQVILPPPLRAKVSSDNVTVAQEAVGIERASYSGDTITLVIAKRYQTAARARVIAEGALVLLGFNLRKLKINYTT